VIINRVFNVLLKKFNQRTMSSDQFKGWDEMGWDWIGWKRMEEEEEEET
jgi:hypothetical protein